MKKNSGNALWFILLAVFLLGALTVVLTRGSQTTEETGEIERLTISATKLIRYTSGIQNAVQRMIQNGVSESDISFANDKFGFCDGTPWQPAGHNPNCTSNKCEIFHVEGGGLKPELAPEALRLTGACATFHSGILSLNVKNVVGVGTAASDLVLETYSISKDACMALNRILDIPNAVGDAPADAEAAYCGFSGSYACANGTLGDEATQFRGKKAFCHKRPDNTYYFEVVLIAR